MEQTREALTDKLETLEQKVVSSVAAVTDTVANVKEKVHEGVESVKEAVDVKAHVKRHPWLMLGGSVVCGFVLADLVMPGKSASRPTKFTLTPKVETGDGNGRPQNDHPKQPTAGQSWLRTYEPEVQHLKGLALGVTLGTVREMLTTEVPPHIAEHLKEIIDAITRKAGGEPLPSSDWAATKPATTSAAGVR
jgi:ElaB/YqjD/DUF883 family membrane-anchored ribosome-binding protein